MKRKNLKLIFMILICVLIILIGFCGVYVKKGNEYKNWFKDYAFASDIEGATILEFEVDDSSDTIYYDENGNEIDSDEVTEDSNYESKEVAVNAEDVLTLENYKKVVSIMKERLDFLQADQYQIDYDKETGKINLTIEDDYIDDVESILPMEGKLTLVDSDTEEVILDYTDFKSVDTSYASLDEGYEVYLNIKLNESGIEKVNNFNKNSEVVTEVESEATEETEVTEETESTEDTEETTSTSEEKNFKIMFDEEEIAEVSYDDAVLNNKTLRITTASELTSNTTINSKLNTNTVISKLATFGKLPVVYELSATEYIKGIQLSKLNIIIGIIIAINIIIFAYFIIKYKTKGLIAVLTTCTNYAIFLIMIRLVNIQISINSLLGIIGIIILNTIISKNILDNAELEYKNIIKNAYSKSIDAIMVILIILVVFSFTSMTVINTMGLLMFWGFATVLLGNIIFTATILSIANKRQ